MQFSAQIFSKTRYTTAQIEIDFEEWEFSECRMIVFVHATRKNNQAIQVSVKGG